MKLLKFVLILCTLLIAAPQAQAEPPSFEALQQRSKLKGFAALQRDLKDGKVKSYEQYQAILLALRAFEDDPRIKWKQLDQMLTVMSQSEFTPFNQSLVASLQKALAKVRKQNLSASAAHSALVLIQEQIQRGGLSVAASTDLQMELVAHRLIAVRQIPSHRDWLFVAGLAGQNSIYLRPGTYLARYTEVCTVKEKPECSYLKEAHAALATQTP